MREPLSNILRYFRPALKVVLTNASRCLWLVIVAVLIEGCMVGPDYSRPPVPKQEGWQAVESAAALQPEDVRWWRDLKDPLLVDCVEKGISGNQNIKEAEARVCEARALRGVAVASLLPQVTGDPLFNRSQASNSAGIIRNCPRICWAG